jgi:hypothetical protein
MDQSFAVREDGELNMLFEGDVLSCGCSHTCILKNNTENVKLLEVKIVCWTADVVCTCMYLCVCADVCRYHE